MAKVDLGPVNSVVTVYGNIVANTPTTLQSLGSGEWVCVPLYPLNLDITAVPDSSNNVVVTSKSYTGFVIVACYSLESVS